MPRDRARFTLSIMKQDKNTGILYRERRSGPSRAVLLLVHGLGAHGERWHFLSEYFLKLDISVYALELRGFGDADGERGDVASFGVYFRDILRLREIIGEDEPGKKVFLLGESMGGLLAFLTAAAGGDRFAGLICLSPAFKSRLRFGFLDHIRMILAFFMDPMRQFTLPFDSAMCTRDEEMLKTMEANHREHRLATARLLAAIALAQLRSLAVCGRIRIPVLFMQSGEDSLVDPAATRKMFGMLKTPDKVIKEYPGYYHALSIELGRERVFEDIREWVEKRI